MAYWPLKAVDRVTLIGKKYGNIGKWAKRKIDLYGTWEALDSSELIVFDAGVFLDTLATHSENFFFSTFLGAGWGTTRPDLRAPSEF